MRRLTRIKDDPEIEAGSQQLEARKKTLNAITLFFADFSLEVARFKKQSLEKATPGDRSKQCYFNGWRKRVLQGNLNDFVGCICDKGFVGENCEFTSAMVERWMKQVQEYLKEIQKDVESITKQKRSLILSDLTFLNYLPLGEAEIAGVLRLLQEYLVKDPYLENQKSLYMIFDLMLLNCLRLLELERQLSFRDANFNVEAVTQRSELFKLMQAIVQQIENCLEDLRFSNSFLESEGALSQMLTTTFKILEVRYADYDAKTGVVAANPTIDRQWGITGSIVLKFVFVGGSVAKPNVNLQLVTLSLTLFKNLVPSTEALMTMLVYLRHINPDAPHTRLFNKDLGIETLRISFAIVFVPSFDNLEKSIVCRAYTFDTEKSAITGEMVSFDDQNESIECQYPLFFELKNFYFAAAALKEQI